MPEGATETLVMHGVLSANMVLKKASNYGLAVNQS